MKSPVKNMAYWKAKNKTTPTKLSDEAVVSAQKRLDSVELDWREPGWAKAARGVAEGIKNIAGSLGQGS